MLHNTVTPPNKGHYRVVFVVLCREVVSLERLKCIKSIGRKYLGAQDVSFVGRLPMQAYFRIVAPSKVPL